VCLLDLVIVRTSEEEEERRALNLVNKRTVASKDVHSIENESQKNVYSCFLSLIILTKYVVDEVL
jgi:hypothetical protein